MSQHPYMPYLLEDIKAAQRSEEAQKAAERLAHLHIYGTLEEQFEPIDAYLNSDESAARPSLSDFAGLDLCAFPSADQLSDGDMETILKAIEKMALTYNLTYDIPGNAPATIRYTITLEWLADPAYIPRTGQLCLMYCPAWPPECKLGEHCPCWQIWENHEGADERLPEDWGDWPF